MTVKDLTPWPIRSPHRAAGGLSSRARLSFRLRFLLHIHILAALGIFLLIVGLILALLGAAGRAVFGRRHYW
ncbi:MAG: DUF6131 family protein [Pseudonocardiaceae bacterium]